MSLPTAPTPLPTLAEADRLEARGEIRGGRFVAGAHVADRAADRAALARGGWALPTGRRPSVSAGIGPSFPSIRCRRDFSRPSDRFRHNRRLTVCPVP